MAILRVPVTNRDHAQGKESALITLVEYGDYQCPHCGMAYYIVKRIQKYFGDQLRLVFRHFPITEVHPYAEMASETSEFAGDKGHFWEMHNHLFENQSRLNPNLFEQLVQTLSLPMQEYRFAIANKVNLPKIKEDFLGGVRSGVNGTPTFFINEHRYDGSYEFENLISAIEALLAGTRLRT